MPNGILERIYDIMKEPRRVGFVDESYGKDGVGRPVYVVGLLEIAAVDVEGLCHDLRDLPRKRGGLLHFAKEEADRRLALSAAIGKLGLDLTAVVRHGSDRTDRARAVALTTLAGARHTRLGLLVIESRGARPDRTDAALLARLHPPAHRIPTEFLTKDQHPALWVPDFVAGAVFQSLARNAPETLQALGDVERRDC